jgi:hypothetical protein
MDATSSRARSEADDVRSAEQERLSALIAVNMDVARQLHADDFQLITPLGAIFSKEEYLGAVAAGHLHYLAMQLDSPIDVRMYDAMALIRYRAQIEIEVQGQTYPLTPYWFTDSYEKRDGRWQIVWSQGSGIA